jgi:DNA primase
MSIIDDVKQKSDIFYIVGQYTTLTKAGKTFRGLCPFHSEKHGSFFVYPEQQSWHCFGACNTGGDVFSFIMKKQGLTFAETLQTLAEKARITIPSRHEHEPGKDEKEKLYRINKAAAAYYHDVLMQTKEGEPSKEYL